MTSSESQPRTAASRELLDYLVDLRDVGWRDPPGYKNSMHQAREAITDAIQRVKARLPAIEAEAAAGPPASAEPGGQDSRPLDVERLARALDHADPRIYGAGLSQLARIVAAEYARLAAEKPHD